MVFINYWNEWNGCAASTSRTREVHPCLAWRLQSVVGRKFTTDIQLFFFVSIQTTSEIIRGIFFTAHQRRGWLLPTPASGWVWHRRGDGGNCWHLWGRRRQTHCREEWYDSEESVWSKSQLQAKQPWKNPTSIPAHIKSIARRAPELKTATGRATGWSLIIPFAPVVV